MGDNYHKSVFKSDYSDAGQRMSDEEVGSDASVNASSE